jgi:hypothetical protein
LAFFTECLRLRRRHRNSWEDAPIARLFTTADEEATLQALPIFKRLCAAVEKLQKDDEDNIKRSHEEGNEDGQDLTPILERFASEFAQAASKQAPGTGSSNAGIPREPYLDAVDAARLIAEVLPLPMGRFTTTDLIEAVKYMCNAERGRGSGCGSRYITFNALVKTIPTFGAYFAPPPPPEQASGADGGKSMMESLQQMLGYWACEACTTHNDLKVTQCSVCGTPNAVAVAADPESEPWLCPQCTFRNSSANVHCEICNHDSGRKGPGGAGSMPSIVAPEGFWVCSPEKGGCSKYNANNLFYCEVCDKARPDLAAIRF